MLLYQVRFDHDHVKVYHEIMDHDNMHAIVVTLPTTTAQSNIIVAWWYNIIKIWDCSCIIVPDAAFFTRILFHNKLHGNHVSNIQYDVNSIA